MGCFGGGKNPESPCAQKDGGFEESEYWYDRLEKHLGWKSLGKSI